MKLFLNRKEERTWTTRVPLRFWTRFSIARFGICSRSLPACCSNNGTKNFDVWGSSSNRFEAERYSRREWEIDIGVCSARLQAGRCLNLQCRPEGRRYRSVSRELREIQRCHIGIMAEYLRCRFGTSRLRCLGGEPLSCQSPASLR